MEAEDTFPHEVWELIFTHALVHTMNLRLFAALRCTCRTFSVILSNESAWQGIEIEFEPDNAPGGRERFVANETLQRVCDLINRHLRKPRPWSAHVSLPSNAYMEMRPLMRLVEEWWDQNTEWPCLVKMNLADRYKPCYAEQSNTLLIVLDSGKQPLNANVQAHVRGVLRNFGRVLYLTHHADGEPEEQLPVGLFTTTVHCDYPSKNRLDTMLANYFAQYMAVPALPDADGPMSQSSDDEGEDEDYEDDSDDHPGILVSNEPFESH